ncbi:diguanylate cyclase domain-containing protein [Actinoplanes sp. HUAS TT8]|uniref:diguanylate cyclase domain-containing protein n=1 Tax=Actinoplanes sp. HUAS TT8 TaxID=3447453 RepID=UPI003F52685D
MSQRAYRTIGWLVPAFALLAMLVFPRQASRVYAVLMITATVGGTVLHAVFARRQRFWALTATALGCWAYAEVSVGLKAIAVGVAPGRNVVANLINLAALVLAVVAMLALPTAPRTRAGRTRMALDGTVAASALVGVAWALVLGPMTRLEGVRSAIFDLAYPVLAVAVLALALIIMSGAKGAGALRAITGGVLVVSLTLLIEVVGQVAGAGWMRPYVLTGYVTAAGLLAVAPLFPLPARGEREWRPRGLFSDLLPYLPVFGLGVVCIAPTLAGHRLESPLLWIGSVTVAALLARQFAALRGNAALTRELAAEAVHDSLTGLPNRALLHASLGTADLLMMLDLDGFKQVNDTYGHAAGDQLLITIGQRLRVADGLVARLGGDEFAILLRGKTMAEAEQLAATLLRACAEPVPIDDRAAQVAASIGIAERDPQRPAEHLLHDADLALYQAKNQGRGRFRRFGAELAAVERDREQFTADLVAAHRAGEFRLVHLPEIDIATGAILGVEARPYWRDQDLSDFEQAITEAGLLPSVERGLLDTALDQHRAGGVSVRLSAAYLASASAVDDIRTALTRHDVAAQALTIRVVEVGDAAPALRSLRDVGVRVCLDRFGAEPVPVAELRELPLDGIRLDPRFLADPPVLAALLALVHGLGLSSAADGVTGEPEAARLRALGCARASGPLFCAAGLATSGEAIR